MKSFWRHEKVTLRPLSKDQRIWVVSKTSAKCFFWESTQNLKADHSRLIRRFRLHVWAWWNKSSAWVEIWLEFVIDEESFQLLISLRFSKITSLIRERQRQNYTLYWDGGFAILCVCGWWKSRLPSKFSNYRTHVKAFYWVIKVKCLVLWETFSKRIFRIYKRKFWTNPFYTSRSAIRKLSCESIRSRKQIF